MTTALARPALPKQYPHRACAPPSDAWLLPWWNRMRWGLKKGGQDANMWPGNQLTKLFARATGTGSVRFFGEAAAVENRINARCNRAGRIVEEIVR